MTLGSGFYGGEQDAQMPVMLALWRRGRLMRVRRLIVNSLVFDSSALRQRRVLGNVRPPPELPSLFPSSDAVSLSLGLYLQNPNGVLSPNHVRRCLWKLASHVTGERWQILSCKVDMRFIKLWPDKQDKLS